MVVPNRKTITPALVKEVAEVLKIRTSGAGSRTVWERAWEEGRVQPVGIDLTFSLQSSCSRIIQLSYKKKKKKKNPFMFKVNLYVDHIHSHYGSGL